MDEILRLIYDYSKSGKLLDFDALNLILEYYKKTLMLEDYILDFKVLDYPDKNSEKDESSFTKGIYYVERKLIELYIKNIQKSIKRVVEALPWLDCFLFKNIYTLITLFHEIDHAYQRKLCYSKCPNLETLLLSENYLIELKEKVFGEYKGVESWLYLEDYLRKKKIIEKSYSIELCERMADISSFLEAINVFNYIKYGSYKSSDVEISLRCDLKSKLLQGYTEHCCPAQEFLSKIGSIKLWESFAFYDEDSIALRRNVTNQYSLEERLFLGLPIEPTEEKEISAIANSKFITPKRTLFKPPTIKEHFIL